MAKGRLAAAGDFREIRALMDDRPRRVVVRTSEPRLLAADLLQAGVVVGARIEGDDGARCSTPRTRAASAARSRRSRARAGRACSRCGPSTRISRTSSATWWSDEQRARHRAARRRVSGSSSFVALYRLLLRLQVTPLRVVGILALGSLAVLLGALSRSDDDPLRATTEIALGYGLGIVLPLATAWLATSSVGDLVEDRLLVYLWLKPVPRWQLPAAAILATVTIVVPLVAVPLVVAAIVAGASQLIGAILLACVLAVVAYAGVFVAVGLWLRRALWWCLLYILVWENGLARAVDGAARLSIASYAQSLVAAKADIVVSYADRPTGASIVVPIVVGVAGPGARRDPLPPGRDRLRALPRRASAAATRTPEDTDGASEGRVSMAWLRDEVWFDTDVLWFREQPRKPFVPLALESAFATDALDPSLSIPVSNGLEESRRRRLAAKSARKRRHATRTVPAVALVLGSATMLPIAAFRHNERRAGRRRSRKILRA